MKLNIFIYIFAGMVLTGCGCDPSMDITGVSETENEHISAPNNSGTVVVGDGNTVNNYIDGKLVNSTSVSYAKLPNIISTSESSGKYSPATLQIELIDDWLYITNPTDGNMFIDGSYRGATPSNYHMSARPRQVASVMVNPSDNGCISLTSMLISANYDYANKAELGKWTGTVTICQAKN